MPDPFQGILYRKTFLQEVIARVDFLNPLSGVETALPQRLTEAAILTFPIAEPREAVERQVQIGPEGVASREARFTEWHFHGRDREKTLTIGRQVALVQHKAYQTYDVIRAEFIEILDRIADLYQDAQPSRLG